MGAVGIAVLLAAACTGYELYLRGRVVAARDQTLADYIACFRGPPLRAGESLHQRLSSNQATPLWPQRCFEYEEDLYTAETQVADHGADTLCLDAPRDIGLSPERCIEAASHYDLSEVSANPAALSAMPDALLLVSEAPVLAEGWVALAPSQEALAFRVGDRVCRFHEGALECRPAPPDAESAFPIPTTGGWPELLQLEPWQLWVAAQGDGELTRQTIERGDWVPFVRRQGPLLVYARADRVELRERGTLLRQILPPPGSELVALDEAIVWRTPERAWVTPIPSGPAIATEPLVTLALPDSRNRLPPSPFSDSPQNVHWYACVHEGHVTTALWQFDDVSVWFDDAAPVRGRFVPAWGTAVRCERDTFSLAGPRYAGLAQLRCDADGCEAEEIRLPMYDGLGARVAFRGSSLAVLDSGDHGELRIREAIFSELASAPQRAILVPDYGESVLLGDAEIHARGDDLFVFFVRGPLAQNARAALRVAADGSVSALAPR